MSAAHAECWAASRHLAFACPLRETCEATTRERDGLMAEVVRLRSLIDGMAERIAGQSEALQSNAEKQANA